MIQIFGKKSCNNSKKVERFFKDRSIKVQYINLKDKGISKGELKSVLNKYKIEELIDKEGKEYKKRNLEYMVYDTEELLMESPELFKTPILRYKGKVHVGYDEKILKEWIKGD